MERTELERALTGLFDESSLEDTARAMAELLEERYGPLPYILRSLQSNPEAFIAEGMRRFRLVTGGRLSPREREAAALAAAASLHCVPCIRTHLERGRRAGFTEEELGEILRVAAAMSEAAVLAVAVRQLEGVEEE